MRRSRFPIALLPLLSLLPLSRLAAQNVTELYVAPDTLRLEAGQRKGLTVQAFDEAGNAILAVRFRVADPGVARVAGNGIVTASRAGRTMITVLAGQKSRQVPVLVSGMEPEPAAASAPAPEPVAQARPAPTLSDGMTPPAEVVRLVAEPGRLTLLPQEHAVITIRGIRADGSSGPPPELIWRAMQPSVAMLADSSGTIAGVGPGQGVIQVIPATGAPLSVPVTVVLTQFILDSSSLVLSPDDADTLHATVPALNNRPVAPAELQWLADDPGVVQVTPDGVVRALRPGRTDVVVRGLLQERRVPVVVHRRVAHFLVAPRIAEPVRLPVQGTREFTVIPQTVDSVPIEGVPLNWNVEDTAVARFDPTTGVLTTLRPGRTSLTFAAPGFAPKGWTIEVLPGTIALSRSRLTLRAGQRDTLAGQFVDAAGRPVGPASGLDWVTSNAAVARVSADGVVEALTPGRAVITAQARGGQPVQATVLVTADLLLASSRGGKFGIYGVSAASPEAFLPVIADSFSNALDPAYSPDRGRLAYASDQFGAGNFDIFVADADGRNPVRLTTDPAVDQQPVWSADGTQLVFVSGRSGIRQLYVMKTDGTEVRQLTALPGGAEEPAVSPDGRTVAFTGYPGARDGQTDIYTVPFTGGKPVPVTDTRDQRESKPFYLPSGALGWVRQGQDKAPDQVVQQVAGSGPPVVLVSTQFAIQGVALARDGSRLAWIGTRPSARNRNLPEFTFQWRTLATGAEIGVRLLPGERITSPTF